MDRHINLTENTPLFMWATFQHLDTGNICFLFQENEIKCYSFNVCNWLFIVRSYLIRRVKWNWSVRTNPWSLRWGQRKRGRHSELRSSNTQTRACRFHCWRTQGFSGKIRFRQRDTSGRGKPHENRIPRLLSQKVGQCREREPRRQLEWAPPGPHECPT